LKELEHAVLSKVMTPRLEGIVELRKISVLKKKEVAYISTKIYNKDSKNVPMILLHDIGTSSASFAVSIDELAKNRPVYTIDLPGFGRSKGIAYSKRPKRIETQIVDIIFAWIKGMGLTKFMLCGHGFGGYVAALYALRRPGGILHLVLIDPWGFPKKPKSINIFRKSKQVLAKELIYLSAHMIGSDYFCNDLLRIYNVAIMQNTSGTEALMALQDDINWSHKPIMTRIGGMAKEVQMTFLCGSMSYIDHSYCSEVKKARRNSFVDIRIVENASHNIHLTYAKFPTILNAIGTECDGVLDCEGV